MLTKKIKEKLSLNADGKMPQMRSPVTYARYQALDVLAKQRATATKSRVSRVDLIGDAIEIVYGKDLDEVLLREGYPRCEQCGLVGGCEHTFRNELP